MSTGLRRLRGILLGLAAGLAPLISQARTAAAEGDEVVATFEGGTLLLSESWGEAKACYVSDEGTRCYRSEEEMDDVESSSALLADCSSSLRLYRSTAYGGGVLNLAARATPISLSAYGFDNDTSSFKVGACSVRLYDGAVGSTQYPNITTSGTWASSMAAGWDNRVSSVYIL